MKKFLKFCKAPLMSISCTLFGIALVCMIVVLSISHGSYYVGTDSSDPDIILKYELELSGEDLTFKTYQNGELADTYTNKFKIEDGKLLEFQSTEFYTSFLGLNINSLKVVPDSEAGEIKAVLTCPVNNAILISSIVVLCLSVLAFAFSLYLILKDSKIKSKK